MAEDQRHRLGAEQWDGTEPYDFASAPAFPLKDYEWNGIREILDLPEASRPDFDVLVSVLRGFMDEKGYDLPPGKTVRQLSAFAEKLDHFKKDFADIAMNGTVSSLISSDGEFWFTVTSNVRLAADRMREYARDISSKKARTGQDWAYLDRFANIAENILNRHGLTLAVTEGGSERRERSKLFLQKLFSLSTCKLKPSTSAKIVRRITAHRRDRVGAQSGEPHRRRSVR